MKILNKTQNDSELVDVERDASNKWHWKWTKTSINVDPAELQPKLKWTGGPITVVATDYICKINVVGTALCQISTSTMNTINQV